MLRANAADYNVSRFTAMSWIFVARVSAERAQTVR